MIFKNRNLLQKALKILRRKKQQIELQTTTAIETV